ncbi:hypothetical protein OS121_13150 [Mycolicibacterium mucogenicum]|uniref:hypothetical protein n=1 Tax=Mycolicibacterium mucogenicum TaxID=56689 RepID=UPI00226A25A3|nr:hypothetical protein [Mycolicibacterium mucogenicum]MCX8556031.1 hypothetical protein [Mycolicibacterium mucogenicum]
MRKREQPQGSGYLFNGKVYPTEAEYLAAVEKRDERRRRIIAAMNEPDRNHA